MDSSGVIFIIAGILLFFLPIVNFVADLKSVKNEIRDDLQKRGATNIDVHYNSPGWGTTTFDAVYTDVQGNRQKAQCQVKTLRMMFMYGEVVWSEPVKLKSVKVMSKHSHPPTDEISEEVHSQQ